MSDDAKRRWCLWHRQYVAELLQRTAIPPDDAADLEALETYYEKGATPTETVQHIIQELKLKKKKRRRRDGEEQ